jgi:hypothetical protein
MKFFFPCVTINTGGNMNDDQKTYQELKQIYPLLIKAHLLELSICVAETIHEYEEKLGIPKECQFLEDDNGEI